MKRTGSSHRVIKNVLNNVIRQGNNQRSQNDKVWQKTKRCFPPKDFISETIRVRISGLHCDRSLYVHIRNYNYTKTWLKCNVEIDFSRTNNVRGLRNLMTGKKYFLFLNLVETLFLFLLIGNLLPSLRSSLCQ